MIVRSDNNAVTRTGRLSTLGKINIGVGNGVGVSVDTEGDDTIEDGVKDCEVEAIKDVVSVAANLKQKCNTIFWFVT